MNCGGTALFNFQTEPWTNRVEIAKADFDKIEIAHSMPKIVTPEIRQDTTWMLEYRIPFDFLEKYSPVVKPEPGVKWRTNFYKCADNSSHPHWLTWSKVDYSRPNFHLPHYFGELEFGASTKVGMNEDEVPTEYALSTFPNPFNSETRIQFTLATDESIALDIYNINGEKITTLVEGPCPAGTHAVNWNASGLASGVYICRLQIGDEVRQTRITFAG